MILDQEFYGSDFDFPKMVRKYALLLCTVFLVRSIGFTVVPIFYNEISHLFGITSTYWLPQSITFVTYIMNIITAIVLYLDMQKERLMSYPILVLAVFQNEGAVILFLLLVAYDRFWRRRDINPS